MKISVITVCFNSAATLAETIASVASQDHAEIEHIIVDGASQDDTLSIIQSHPTISKWISEADNGVYDAMNKGIALASGEVIGTLNADDVYAGNHILTQVAEIFSDPTVDACFADLLYVDQHDTSKIIRYWKSTPYRNGLFKSGWMPAHPTFFVRRRVYEQFGGFDLRFRRQSDFELTMRFLEVHKIKSIYCPEIWVKMRMGGLSNNSISGIIKGNIEAYYACRKNGLNVNMAGFIARKVMSRIPQFFNKPD